MADVPVIQDREIGRGRRYDSSSSRESSPRRPQKRSFSPTSDDGDLVVPPIADDDTPPPPERPLLRQAVGFASAVSTNLNTYQDTFTTSDSRPAFFLPGQMPQLPKPKKKGAPRKKKRPNEYSSQMGRFRLDNGSTSLTNPGPSQSQPGHINNGNLAAITPGHTGTDVRSVHPSSPTLASSSALPYDNRSETSASPSPDPFPTTNLTVRQWRASDLPPPKPNGRKKTTISSPAKNTAHSKAANSALAVQPQTRSTSVETGSSVSTDAYQAGKYYRHDYDREATPRNPPARELSLPRQVHDSAPDPSATTTSPSANRAIDHNASSDALLSTTTRVPRQPLRMVTILIQDIRSGTVDHQLAEVKIPLKPADNPDDGFWADAKELSQQLQVGPSRIDGPAKVYTLRGKYRQFFLRVSAENVNDFASVNLVVKPDRTIDVVVETLLPPGTLPPPPQIPKDLQPEIPEESDASSPKLTETEMKHHTLEKKYYENLFGKGTSSESSDESMFDPIDRRLIHGDVTLRQMLTDNPVVEDPSSPKIFHDSSRRRYPSPQPDDEPEMVHKIMTDAADFMIPKDKPWTEYFRAKAAPQSVPEVLKQYEYVKSVVDSLVGKKTPYKSGDFFLEKSHILAALQVKDPKFMPACEETLELLKLYGKGGLHGEDPIVVAMCEDGSAPEYNAKPVKRLLRELRRIDESWKREHSRADDTRTKSRRR